MKKLFLLFLCITLAFSLTLERPWDYDYWAQKNPDITVIFGAQIWNTGVMQGSLDSLDLGKLSELNNDGVEKTIYSYNEAMHSKEQCDEIGDMATSIWMIVSRELLIIELSYKEITEATVSNCLKYPEYWKGTMNNALDSLENDYGNLEEKCAGAVDMHAEMNHSGLCDYSPEQCETLTEIAKNCKGIYYFGDFSKIYGMDESLDSIKDEIQNPKPNLEEYSGLMLTLNSGIINNIEFYTEKGRDNLELAKQDFELLENEVSVLKNKAENKYSELEKHNLEKISAGSVITGYLGGEVVSVSLDFESIGEDLEDAGIIVDSAEIYYKSKNKNYLKNSIEDFETAKEMYEDLYDEMEGLEDEAVEIVEAKKAEAEQKLNIFISEMETEIVNSKTDLLFSYAEEYYYEGVSSEKYGDKYYYFRECVKLVNLAEISINEESGEEEMFFYSELSNLKILIENAETDELNVEYEKLMANYLDMHPSPAMLGVIDDLKNGIISKAKLRYSGLEKEREEIRKLINVSNADFGYFLSVLEDKERYVFVNSKIDYKNAVGRLKDLEETYFEIKESILYDIENVLPSNVKVKEIVGVGSCVIGENCEFRIGIEIKNPYEISLENPKIKVSLPFEIILYKNNVIAGEEHINDLTVDGEELSLYFFEIKPEQTYYLLISKNITLIEIKELNVVSEGNPDGTASVDYEYKLDAKYEVENPELPATAGEIKKVELDGVPRSYSDNVLENIITEGNHELLAESFIRDAFSIEKTNIQVTEIGLKKKVIYNLEITANIELENTMLILEEGYSDKVKELSVISYSGHQIKNKKTTSSGKYSFEVCDIKKDETAIVRVEYLVDDAADYIEEEIEKLKTMNLTKTDIQIISEIESFVDMNDTTTALEKLKDLEKDLEKRIENQYKLELKFDSLKKPLEKELEEITDLLNQNLSSDDEFLTKLEFRKEELEEILGKCSVVDDANLELLEGVDEKWMSKEIKNFIKRIYSDYNNVKKEIIELGFLDEAKGDLEEFETDMNELEVKYNLEKVPDILIGLENLKEYLEEIKNSVEGMFGSKKSEFYDLRDGLNADLEIYSMQYDDAAGSSFESLFEYSPGDVEDKINNMEKNIEKYELEELENEVLELGKMESSVNELLEYLETESGRRITEIELLYSDMEISDEEKNKAEKAIGKLKEMYGNKEYVKVLKGSELMLKGEYEFGEDGFAEMVLLGITVLLILIMIFYLVKDQIKGKFSFLDNLFKKKEEEVKKLKRGDEE